jgi:hypothetical protein
VLQIASDDFPDGAPLVVRFVWEARWKLGALFGWDGKDTGRHPGDLASGSAAERPA